MGAALAASAIGIAALMIAVWALSATIRDASIVDIAWGPGFAVVAWVAFTQTGGNDARRLLAAALTTIWGLRLGAYLAARNLGKGEDKRYQAMRRNQGEWFWLKSLLTVFALQGVLMWIVSLPVQAAQTSARAIGPLDVAGAIVWAAGLFFEATGDAQLARFKRDPANAGQVMDRGLWRYTRHPNYFGDFLVWWGLWLIAVSAGAWWTAVGPLVMSVLLIRVSGAGLLEKTIGKRRPGYDDYVRRTSGFIPMPPKRA